MGVLESSLPAQVLFWLQPLNRLQRTLISRSAPMEDVMDVCGTGGWIFRRLRVPYARVVKLFPGEIACLFTASDRSAAATAVSTSARQRRERRSVRQWRKPPRQHPAAFHRFSERRLVQDAATRHRRQTEVPTRVRGYVLPTPTSTQINLTMLIRPVDAVFMTYWPGLLGTVAFLAASIPLASAIFLFGVAFMFGGFFFGSLQSETNTD